MEHSERKEYRNTRIDIARGLLIFYIVTLVHGMYWLGIIKSPLKSLLLFEMPCIFVLSGYSYALSVKNGLKIQNIRDYLKFCTQRSARILIPFFAVAFACLAVIYCVGNPKLFENFNAARDTILTWINPLTYGNWPGSTWIINWHLWFITPFLLITFLLPLVSRITIPVRIPIWVWLFICAAIIKGISFIEFGNNTAKELFQTSVTYLFWGAFGYAIGSNAKIKRKEYLFTLFLSIFSLVIYALVENRIPDIQENKFPPSALFFFFSAAWLSLFSIVFSGWETYWIQKLFMQKWFQPFMKNGYSIYLWQGLAYGIARTVGIEKDLSFFIMWIMAISLSILMGMLASPIERIKIKLF